MAILDFKPIEIGFIGNSPRLVAVLSNDTYSTITAPGYLNSSAQQGNVVYPTDYLFMSYGTDSTTHGIFFPTFSSGTITLNPYVGEGNVELPVTVNHIATFKATDGQIGDDSATAINGGNVQAGLSGTAGYLATFPSTAARGSLHVTAVANTGNTITTISNAAMGQASVVSIPDPATATANFVVAPAALVNNNLLKASGTAGLAVDTGIAATAVQLSANIKANTAAYGGGSTSTTYTITGVTTSSIVWSWIAASSNAAFVESSKVLSPNTVTVTFNADPGANTTIGYIAFIAAQ